MPKKLLHLYLRTATGAARIAFHLTAQAAKLAADAVGLSPNSRHTPPRGEPAAPPPPATRQPEPEATTATAAAPTASAETATSPPPPQLADLPEVPDYDATPITPLSPEQEHAKTVDDEPELVGEFGEPGAEEDVGATVDIGQPWDGYDSMNADEVIRRLGESDAAQAAVVELYERAHKQRQTVLSSAERRVRNGAASAS